MSLTRRRFLAGAAVTAAAAGAATKPSFANIALPNVAARTVAPSTPIDTTVVLMMENRSADHYLGWYAQEQPGFRGAQQRTFLRTNGTPVATENWGAGGRREYSGCGFKDPGHSWNAGRVQVGQGDADTEPDGFIKDGSGNDEFALSYYGPEDVPVHAALIRRFTGCDNYFASVLGPTYPNREYLHSGQGLTTNAFPWETGNPAWAAGFTWPTIWDTLTERGVTWAYYYSNLPVVALWGAKYTPNARPIADYYADAALGQLPQVAFVDPWFVGPEGQANDDHPQADLRLGQALISDVFLALAESSHWESSTFILTYDEWGGFWDHITPPKVDDPRAALGFDQLGFRVPTIVASPFARKGQVDHGLYDHTSIIRFIERNYGLRRLNKLDPNSRFAGARSIERVFRDFKRFNPAVDADAFRYEVTPEILAEGCEARDATGATTAKAERTPVISDLYRGMDVGWFDTHGFDTDLRFEDSFRR